MANVTAFSKENAIHFPSATVSAVILYSLVADHFGRNAPCILLSKFPNGLVPYPGYSWLIFDERTEPCSVS